MAYVCVACCLSLCLYRCLCLCRSLVFVPVPMADEDLAYITEIIINYLAYVIKIIIHYRYDNNLSQRRMIRLFMVCWSQTWTCQTRAPPRSTLQAPMLCSGQGLKALGCVIRERREKCVSVSTRTRMHVRVCMSLSLSLSLSVCVCARVQTLVYTHDTSLDVC